MLLALVAIMMLASAIKLSTKVEPRVIGKTETLPLRGILILLVLVTHIPFWRPLQLGTPAVAVFLFLSGYGMVKSYESRGESYIKGHFARTCKKLLKPYVFCAIVGTLFSVASGIYKGDIASRFIEGVALMRHGYLNFVLPYSWFAWELVLLAALFGCAYRFKQRVCQRVVIWVGLVSYYVLFRYVLHFADSWYISLWAFGLGCIYCEFEDRMLSLILRWKWRVPISMLICYAVCFIAVRNGGGGDVSMFIRIVCNGFLVLHVFAIIYRNNRLDFIRVISCAWRRPKGCRLIRTSDLAVKSRHNIGKFSCGVCYA